MQLRTAHTWNKTCRFVCHHAIKFTVPVTFLTFQNVTGSPWFPMLFCLCMGEPGSEANPGYKVYICCIKLRPLQLFSLVYTATDCGCTVDTLTGLSMNCVHSSALKLGGPSMVGHNWSYSGRDLFTDRKLCLSLLTVDLSWIQLDFLVCSSYMQCLKYIFFNTAQ